MYNERALWRFYSVKCNAGHVSFGGLYKNKQTSKQKGSDVAEKKAETLAHPLRWLQPGALVSTAGHVRLCVRGNGKKKHLKTVKQDLGATSEGGGITVCPPGLPAIFVTTETL